ncbi:ECF transporter S component [Streptococcus sp. E17BB]|uniref:ECF transporter S component n=1 Tax=Streptococcus sp. E17BB TaxID=3278714 RepID=UPI00359DB17A
MTAKRLTLASLFMGLTILLSASFLSIPVPGGHFYFNGIIIFLTALLFKPKEAVIIAGFGSFLGDFFFYPEPMFVTLITHSLRVLAIALFVKGRGLPAPKQLVIPALLAGAIIDNIGYFLGRAFVYRTMAYAIIKIPFDLVATIMAISIVYYVYYHTSFLRLFKQFLGIRTKS